MISTPLRIIWLATTLLAMTLVLRAVPVSADVTEDFSKAVRSFNSLSTDSSRNIYRQPWRELEDRFMAIHKRAGSNDLKIKTLFFIGRTNEELGLHSRLRADFARATTYFRKAAASSPRHSWADDSLYRCALVTFTHLDKPAEARSDCNTILIKYTKGDMYFKAKALLGDIIAYQKRQPGTVAAAPRPKPAPVAHQPAPAPKKATPPAAPPAVTEAAPPAPRKVYADGKARLLAVRYQSSDEYTRIVLELSDEVPYRYQILDAAPALNKPHRLYIDMEGARKDDAVTPEVTINDGILRRVRTGQNTADTTRVVLDFQKFQKHQIFNLENPFRIIIDVSAPVPDKADAVQAAEAPPLSKTAPAPAKQSKATATRKPKGNQVKNLIKQLGLKIETIMIDPGHGGRDNGASANGIHEKDVNLSFATILGAHLKKQGFTVLYTRTTDVFIPLEERTAMANVRKADLFVSIHCNAYKDTDTSGFETYYLNWPKNVDRLAERVAARENAVSPNRISDLQRIVSQLTLTSKLEESRDLATSVHATVVSRLRAKYNLHDNGVRTAPFYVLMGAKMPAVLLELGYLTNRTDARRLKSDAYLERKAAAIAAGILDYRDKIEQFAQVTF
ncbi:MAG: N-acetylmuramoyl-L-alanine amidase [Desulfovibrionaceae bacterium]